MSHSNASLIFLEKLKRTATKRAVAIKWALAEAFLHVHPTLLLVPRGFGMAWERQISFEPCEIFF
jgi:hypothetical protein